jgi:uncharacterized protein (DUF111 family)
MASSAGQPLRLLATNVDDVTGETLAHALDAALEAGALDAWITPMVMKKGRPAHVLSALCDPALTDQIRAVMAAETGSAGIRSTTVERWPAPRRYATVDVAGAPVRIKVSPGRAKAAHDDAASVARRTGLPLREVVRRAEQAWHGRDDPDDDPA